MHYLFIISDHRRSRAGAAVCRLDDGPRVVVEDFGLSSSFYDKQYHSSSDRKTKLPVRWMALERANNNFFNVVSQLYYTCVHCQSAAHHVYATICDVLQYVWSVLELELYLPE